MAPVRWIQRGVAALTGDGRREDRQVMAEYGLILAGVAAVSAVGLVMVGPTVSTVISTLAGNF